MSKVWFATGLSKGFGLGFVDGALERGDQAAATGCNSVTLTDLVDKYGYAVLPIQLDVTNRDQAFAAVVSANEKFGRIELVVNNAGCGLFGTVEEITEQQLRDQLETNFFGAFHVTQAALPTRRAQGFGHIIQISISRGVVAFPMLGGYHASKWALEGLSESLAQEVAPLGYRGHARRTWRLRYRLEQRLATFGAPQPAYDHVREGMAKNHEGVVSPKPVGFASAIGKIVDADEAPLRVFFGEMPTKYVPVVYQQRLDTWAAWAPVSPEAEGK